MCGLFGWYEKKQYRLAKDEKLDLTMALGRKSVSRGNDSYGVCFRYNEKRKPYYQIVKSATSFHSGAKRKSMKELSSRSVWLFGHTRYKTHGKATISNAHPFEIKPWIMAHNGVISSCNEYLKKATIMPKGETDSEAYMSFFVSHKKKPEDILDLNSSFDAFELYNNDTGKLYLVTKGRPLFIAEDKELIVWASDSLILETSLRIAIGRRMKDMKTTEIENDQAMELTPGGIVTIKEKTRPTGAQWTTPRATYSGRWNSHYDQDYDYTQAELSDLNSDTPAPVHAGLWENYGGITRKHRG